MFHAHVTSQATCDPLDMSLLIVDDDRPFLARLANAMEHRGFAVRTAASIAEGLAVIQERAPAFAVIDMRLEDGCGLDLVELLREVRPNARQIMLTGYGNVATAVCAVKLGAIDYLAKPADADDVADVLLTPPGQPLPAPEHPATVKQVGWDHIQAVFEASGRNISITARKLSMHRRSLQRVLAKGPPRAPSSPAKW